MALAPRAVVVHRRTEYQELLAHHGTRGQAAFFLQTRGRDIQEIEARHVAVQEALTSVSSSIPADWRRGIVERGDLARFLFAPDDVVVVVGQDGLVANAAKYLQGQPVIGLNPEPEINPGVLVRHPVTECAPLLGAVVSGDAHVQRRTMVQAQTDDGQTLLALNEIYLGHPSHQSARYRLQAGAGPVESQSSSGILIGTGTGATGWCGSAWQERASSLRLPGPDEAALCWFVREAWPSPVTGTSQTEGVLPNTQSLTVTSAGDGLVIFGDGIEYDRITLAWGQQATIATAAATLALV